MRLVQFLTPGGERCVALVRDSATLQLLQNTSYVRDLVLEAQRARQTVNAAVEARLSDETVNYEQVVTENRLLPPLDHPDPAHCILSLLVFHLSPGDLHGFPPSGRCLRSPSAAACRFAI